ncbi:MAG: hypothetical protein LBK61_13885, partial [Spirochaetaceae bacterium]|nr:hypothetical protein [Spirochaetaceae bacterium]
MATLITLGMLSIISIAIYGAICGPIVPAFSICPQITQINADYAYLSFIYSSSYSSIPLILSKNWGQVSQWDENPVS